MTVCLVYNISFARRKKINTGFSDETKKTPTGPDLIYSKISKFHVSGVNPTAQ